MLRQLTTSKQYLDQVLAAMADMLIVTTAAGTIKTVNAATKTLLGYEEAELKGQSIFHVLQLLESSAIDPQFWDDRTYWRDIEATCYDKQRQPIPVAFSRSIIPTEQEGWQDVVYIRVAVF